MVSYVQSKKEKEKKKKRKKNEHNEVTKKRKKGKQQKTKKNEANMRSGRRPSPVCCWYLMLGHGTKLANGNNSGILAVLLRCCATLCVLSSFWAYHGLNCGVVHTAPATVSPYL